jgi:ribosomal protein L7/L12
MNYEPYNQFSWKASDYATVQSSEFGVTVHITDKGFQTPIHAVKAIRELTGFGLVEAKNLFDSLRLLHIRQKVKVAKESATKLFHEAIKTLIDAGVSFEINDIYKTVFDREFKVAA